MSNFLGIQEKDDPEIKPAYEPTSGQRSQPHISLATLQQK
jgi:hypothetical protein